MTLQVTAAADIGDISATSDLTSLIAQALAAVHWADGSSGIRSGDIVVVTSKVVSKSEGRVVACADAAERERIIDSESVRLLARRGSTRIVETHHGLVLAAAGVDESNTDSGTVVLLPLDPDESARRIRAGLLTALGEQLAVVITDTMGRAWRLGVTDQAIGAAGLRTIEDLRGTRDHTGRLIERTIIATADQVAGAAALVGAKDSRRPVSVVRGLDSLVIPEDGPGASALIRPADEDMFRYGTID
jgi:coenzyme F420-0:L-glutamate ligase / coenzyme F420-1:gamma-L-glutamate ligase